MGVMRTNAAAAMLGVSPSTLRSWERRFGYPEPRRSSGGHRQFELGEIEALRAAFQETQNVSSAIALARDRGAGPATPARLRGALSRFDEGEADRVLEESLAVRSVERTVEEVLLPGVGSLDRGSAEQAFAWRWATGWLAAAKRVAPPASRDEAVVIFDSSAPGDADALHAQALELALRRRGVRTLTLAATLETGRLARALHAVEPRAVVLTGCHASLDALARLVYAARRDRGDGVSVFDFRGALPETGASTVERLGSRPLAAAERILAVVEGRAGVPARTLRAVNG
ncbi:MAG: MerR family transcriptional regulator, light-induced transcriptional regulator [Solirubrobacteraceae bacterium]|jgi:Mrp family chromosome partitioning ATPase|nr:MerR family transcriptional regulator, light-induced transcriptional regulator [Solirubrobacteraceae bacterium]